MKYIGIITAIDEEFSSIKSILSNSEEIKIYNITCLKVIIENKNVILTKCGVGKVNSARTTQILIDKFNIDYIINIGVAGGLKDYINIGDIVIGEKLAQHDFNITPFNHPMGYINEELGIYMYSNKKLVEKCQDIKLHNTNIYSGTIVSGDLFCTKEKHKANILKEFNADCVEMEGASIAQVCTLCNIPFIVIRSISDKPNGSNQIDYNEFVEASSKKIVEVIKIILKKD